MGFVRLRSRLVVIGRLGSALILAWHSTAFAQAPSPATPPAYLSFVEGDAMMAHEGQFEPAVISMPVVATRNNY